MPKRLSKLPIEFTNIYEGPQITNYKQKKIFYTIFDGTIVFVINVYHSIER